jgi:hypothetical protein
VSPGPSNQSDWSGSITEPKPGPSKSSPGHLHPFLLDLGQDTFVTTQKRPLGVSTERRQTENERTSERASLLYLDASALCFDLVQLDGSFWVKINFYNKQCGVHGHDLSGDLQLAQEEEPALESDDLSLRPGCTLQQGYEHLQSCVSGP